MQLDLLTMIVATGSGSGHSLEPDHLFVLSLCRFPLSVAEIAARLRLPAVVTKVLLSDLVDCGVIRMARHPTTDEKSNQILLERLLDGLQRRL
jgi:predicted transcriptional regulator